jgi:hypothetical protein
MQAVSTTLAPPDNVELLTLLAGLYRSVGKRDRAALARAMGEVLRVLARSPLLVALEREGKVALTSIVGSLIALKVLGVIGRGRCS